MAYEDFTIAQLTASFGIDFQGARLFAEVPPVEPSPWLLDTLALGRQLGFGSAKSRAERLVSPVLAELTRRNDFVFALVSGGVLDADAAHGLTGSCDFVLSASRLQSFLLDARCCVTVTRGTDDDPTLERCAAQLLGARQLNQRSRYRSSVLYGSYTTGTEWQFLRFESNVFTLDPTHYSIAEPAQLLGVFQYIVDQTHPAATPASPDSP